jgi:hypothetical protein
MLFHYMVNVGTDTKFSRLSQGAFTSLNSYVWAFAL